MNEVIFLIVLALIWVGAASIQDLKKREVPNWLNFSLIIFALGFRFFYSLFSGEFNFFYQGLIGFGIFFIVGNILYYSRMFAGGDAKLMIAMGAVLPFSKSLLVNLNLYIWFILIFLFVGSFYGIAWSFGLGIKNFKKFRIEFSKRLNSCKKIIFLIMAIGIILIGFGFIEKLFFYMGILIFVTPSFYLYAKSIDEVCMIKKVKTEELTEGDWLYQNIKIGKKTIKSKWDGLSKEEIKFLSKNKKFVLIRQGIPFVPVFLISFLIFLFVWKSGLGNSFW